MAILEAAEATSDPQRAKWHRQAWLAVEWLAVERLAKAKARY